MIAHADIACHQNYERMNRKIYQKPLYLVETKMKPSPFIMGLLKEVWMTLSHGTK